MPGRHGVSVVWLLTRLERLSTRWWPQDSAPARPLSVLLLLPLQAFAYWSLCPMETICFTALLLGAVAALFRSPLPLGTVDKRGSRVCMWKNRSDFRRGDRPVAPTEALLFVLLSLTRPEGVYIFGVWLAILVALGYRRHGRALQLRAYLRSAVVFLALFGSYFVWRWVYYGRWLPNTFYAKVTGGEGQVFNGLVYFKDWLCAFPLLAATLGLPLALLRKRAEPTAPPLAVYLLTVAYTAYVIVVGGDFMPFYRFFVPVMPLYCLLLAWALRWVLSGWAADARVPSLILAAVFAVHVACSLFTEQAYRAFVADRTAVVGKAVGEWFKTRLGPDDLIAVNTAGSLPYYSRLPALDMLGLTDAQIAHRPVFIVSPHWAGHRRGWGDYVLERRPRIILWYNSAGLHEPYYLGDHELADNPFFRFFYRPKTATLPAADERVRVAERFFGFPFGFTTAGETAAGDLGLRVRFREHPLPMTSLYEGPITLSYFELDRHDAALWQVKEQSQGRVDAFVDTVSQMWQRDETFDRSGDPQARARVEAMAADAYRLIEAKEYRGAQQILAAAASRNATAKSPLVYQYTANLAVMTGDLFVAIGAQKEALRLAPGNPLYQSNLKHLLAMPYKKAVKPRGTLEQKDKPRQ